MSGGCGAARLVRIDMEATGLTEVSKGRITLGGLVAPALREETSLCPGAKVNGG